MKASHTKIGSTITYSGGAKDKDIIWEIMLGDEIKDTLTISITK